MDAIASDSDGVGDATANDADSRAGDGADGADFDAGDADNNSDLDAIVSDSDDVGDAIANDADPSAGDGADGADFDAGDVANDAGVGTGSVNVFDDSDSDLYGCAGNTEGDTGDATKESDDDDDDDDRSATSPNDGDADTAKLDNMMTCLGLGEEFSVVGNKVSRLVANDSATNCIDDARTTDVGCWLGVVSSVCITVLLVSLTCVAEILMFVRYARLFVAAVRNSLVLLGDMVRFFKIYSIPLHSALWITNTSPAGQINLATVFSGNSVSLTAIIELSNHSSVNVKTLAILIHLHG